MKFRETVKCIAPLGCIFIEGKEPVEAMPHHSGPHGYEVDRLLASPAHARATKALFELLAT